MIKIICLGKIKEPYLADLIDDYLNRIKKYHKIEIIELKDEIGLQEEAKNILKHVGSRDYLVACSIEGTKLASEEFAKKMNDAFVMSGTIDFIIGSSNGLSDVIKKRADLNLSFSDMTMPHGLFRGILLEQIYRAFKINNNEKYHK